MCRLGLVGAVSPDVQQLITHVALLGADAERQEHGWGLLSPYERGITKSLEQYYEDASNPIERHDATRPWVFHTRSASAGTSRGFLETHPLVVFDKSNKRAKLFGLHNGWVAGTVIETKDRANSDSYRTFRELGAIVGDAHTLTREHLEQWLSEMTEGTSSSFMIVDAENRVHVLRNERTLFIAQSPAFTFVTTSEHIARSVDLVGRCAFGVETQITPIEPFSYYTADMSAYSAEGWLRREPKLTFKYVEDPKLHSRFIQL